MRSTKLVLDLDYLFDRCMPIPESGCWAWYDMAVAKTGYAMISVGWKMRTVHRVAYELAKGPIPDGKQIDHLCRVRCCINPDHLEAVSSHENTMRGYSPSSFNAKKTLCKNGHDLAEGRHWISARNGRIWRKCKICELEYGREYYHRTKNMS